MLGAGALAGHVFSTRPVLPLAALSCGGFFLVGVLAALWRWFRSVFKRIVSMEVKSK